MKEEITIKDIAREAGVCIATVSNAINKKEKVSKETIDKIETIISKYNYHIKNAASLLRGKRSKLIGVIVTDVSNYMVSIVVKEIEEMARKEGYSLVICNNSHNPKLDIKYIDMLMAREVEGLIFIPSEEKLEIIKNLNKEKFPTVLFNRQISGSGLDYVMVDYYNAMVAVVDYLYGLGHKNIAYIAREKNLLNAKRKLKGFKEAMIKNKIKFKEKFYIEGDELSIDTGYSDTLKLLNMKEKPTAIIAFNDILAFGVIQAILENGYRIPDDFSVIGFDNFEIDKHIQPSLTSVNCNKKLFAKTCFNQLLQKIKGIKTGYDEKLIPFDLVIRDSTGKIN